MRPDAWARRDWPWNCSRRRTGPARHSSRAYIDQLNKDRQTVERRMFKQAKELVEANEAWLAHPALVLPSTDWHGGVMGIVANRIAEHFTRPTIMLKVNEAAGTAHGSGRSFGGFDLHAALGACADILEGFGGHSFAAGVRLSRANVDAFREKLASVALDYFVEGVEEPPLEVDAEVSLADLTPRAVRELDRLGPYGAEHRRPVFAASRLELVEEPKKFGGGDRHLSLRVKQNNKVLRAVAFGRAEWAEEIIAAGDGPLSLCFQPQMNEFRGFETVELHLVDWKTAEHGAMTPAATA